MENTENIQTRPIIITIICWFMIIGTLFIPVVIYMGMNNPQMVEIMEKASAIPPMVQYGLMGLGVIVNLWAAISMLKGKALARTVYAVYNIVILAINLVASNMKESLIVTIIITIVTIGLLYIPSANRYFASKNA